MKTQYGYMTPFNVMYRCGDFVESDAVDFEDPERIQIRMLKERHGFDLDDQFAMKCQPYILIPADVPLDDLLDTIECLMQVARAKEKQQRQSYTANNTSEKTDTSEIVNDVIGEIDEFFDGAVNFVKSQFAKMLDNMKAK